MSKLQEHAIKYIEILDSLLKVDLRQLDMLFVCDEDSTPMEFCMKPSKDEQSGEFMKKLSILVDKCGGSMKFNNFHTEGLANSIKLVNKGESVLDTNEDYFYSDFLIDCMLENKLKDLDNYRANKSKYCTNLNVLDILNKRKNWNEAKKTKISDEEISDFDDNENCNMKNTPKNLWKASKSTYLREEDLKILLYIVKYKAFHRVKSRRLWQEMEKKNICSGRTWQSMKERLKYIIPKIKTYHLSELNQSAIIDGFRNPNSHAGTRQPVIYSSTESENEDALPPNQNKEISATQSMMDGEIDDSNNNADKNNSLLNNRCEDISDDIVDRHSIKQMTSTDNLTNTSCNSSKLMAYSDTEISDETYHPAIISESTDEKCSDDEIILNGKKLASDDENEDVETNINKSSGRDCENEINKNQSYIDETDIEEDEGFRSALPGINILLRNDKVNINSSLNSGMKISNNNGNNDNSNNAINTEDDSQLVESEIESVVIEDEDADNIDDAEDVDNAVTGLGCSYSLKKVTHNTVFHEFPDEISSDGHKSKRLSNENVVRKGSTLIPIDEDLLSDNDSNKTQTFYSDEVSLYSKSSLKRRKKENSTREYLTKAKVPMPADQSDLEDQSENELSDSIIDSDYKSKFTLTFHEKHGCKKKFIGLNSRYVNMDSKFSIEEDFNIIKYIYKHHAFDHINGRNMWVSMKEKDAENSKGERTWQSLKDRFKRRILPNINQYEKEGLSKRIIRTFNNVYKEKKPDEFPIKENEPANVQEENEPANVQEENEPANVKEENDSSDTDNGIPHRRFYSEKEKQAIVDYIIKTRRYRQIKGNVLYQMMAKHMPNKKKRSWQSLQNTFKKYIIPKIKDYVKSQDILSKFETVLEISRKKRINFKRPPAISSESSDCESSDIGSYDSATTSSSIAVIRKVQRSSTGDGHIKSLNFTSSSNDSDNENEKKSSSSSRKDNLQKEPDNVDIDKGRKVVKKRKLFTESDELFRRTPYLGPTTSRLQDAYKIKKHLSTSSNTLANSSKTENKSSDLIDTEKCTNSIDIICEAITTPEIETLSKKGNMTLASSPKQCKARSLQPEIMSRSKHLSPENLCQETKDENNSSRKKKPVPVMIPRIRNEVVTLNSTPCKDTIKDESNKVVLSSEKKRCNTMSRVGHEQNSPSTSASKQKLRSHSNIYPGKQNKKDYSMDGSKPKLRSKHETDTTLRHNLRVQKIKSRRSH